MPDPSPQDGDHHPYRTASPPPIRVRRRALSRRVRLLLIFGRPDVRFAALFTTIGLVIAMPLVRDASVIWVMGASA